MNMKLFISAVVKFLLGAVLVSLLLFLPAGTFNYPNAWLFIGLLFVPMFAAGIVLMFKNPDLLKKRLNAKENESEQKKVIGLSGIMFVLGFIVAGLDFRFKWLVLPKPVAAVAAVVFLIRMLCMRRYSEKIHTCQEQSKFRKIKRLSTADFTELYVTRCMQ